MKRAAQQPRTDRVDPDDETWIYLTPLEVEGVRARLDAKSKKLASLLQTLGAAKQARPSSKAQRLLVMSLETRVNQIQLEMADLQRVVSVIRVGLWRDYGEE